MSLNSVSQSNQALEEQNIINEIFQQLDLLQSKLKTDTKVDQYSEDQFMISQIRTDLQTLKHKINCNE
jgi:hypothetical protein